MPGRPGGTQPTLAASHPPGHACWRHEAHLEGPPVLRGTPQKNRRGSVTWRPDKNAGWPGFQSVLGDSLRCAENTIVRLGHRKPSASPSTSPAPASACRSFSRSWGGWRYGTDGETDGCHRPTMATSHPLPVTWLLVGSFEVCLFGGHLRELWVLLEGKASREGPLHILLVPLVPPSCRGSEATASRPGLPGNRGVGLPPTPPQSPSPEQAPCPGLRGSCALADFLLWEGGVLGSAGFGVNTSLPECACHSHACIIYSISQQGLRLPQGAMCQARAWDSPPEGPASGLQLESATGSVVV